MIQDSELINEYSEKIASIMERYNELRSILGDKAKILTMEFDKLEKLTEEFNLLTRTLDELTKKRKLALERVYQDVFSTKSGEIILNDLFDQFLKAHMGNIGNSDRELLYSKGKECVVLYILCMSKISLEDFLEIKKHSSKLTEQEAV